MHNHDYELIMALAEGTLGPAAAASARVEIDACPECAQDLELQIEGLRALQELPTASLTELESARLHRNLRRELGIARPREQQPVARRRLPLAALGTAAAVLVAVVLVGPGLNLIGGADSSDAPDIVAATAEASRATTAAPAVGQDLFEAGESVTEGAADAAAAPTAAPTTAAPGATTTTIEAAVEEAQLQAYFRDESADLNALREDLADMKFDEGAARSYALRLADDSILADDLTFGEACIAITLSSENDFLEGFQLARGRIDGREVLIVVYLAEDPEEFAVIAHAADNCEVLGRAGP